MHQGLLFFLRGGIAMRKESFFLWCLLMSIDNHLYSMQHDDTGSRLHQGFSDQRIAMIQSCVELAISVAQRGYHFFKKDQIEYDLQADVLDDPYKSMVYEMVQTVERLFDDANQHDNPLVQIGAIIRLFRLSVPQWYVKSFQKGLDLLFEYCFDEAGNFVDASKMSDIRIVFKDYCRKAPVCWQDVASISPWWCKHKKLITIQSKYYAITCTDYNADLLDMIEADWLTHQAYLDYVLHKYESAIAYKIYEYKKAPFFKKSFESTESEMRVDCLSDNQLA